MAPALWGVLTAVGWGTGDFIARFTSRSVGHVSALFGSLAVGLVLLVFWAWIAGVSFYWDRTGIWLLLLSGVGIMGASLLLYQGLAMGPIAVVSPIVASYPVFIIVIAMVLGARPSLAEWVAMMVVMGGVFMVARYADHMEEAEEVRKGSIRTAVIIALGSSLGFAIAISAGQLATTIYGEFQTAVMTRSVALMAMLPFFFTTSQKPHIPFKWWPLIGMQGIMDGGGYLALFNGSAGEGGVITAVVASGFTGVTVILARVVIRESITVLQWGGIFLVVSGVSALTWFGN